MVVNITDKSGYLDAKQVFNFQRFDVCAKSLYLRFLDNSIDSDFGREVYEHHLKVWNGLREHYPVKVGLDQYISSFKQIAYDIKHDKFDWDQSPLLIYGGNIINGGHRLTAALYFNKPVKVALGHPTQGSLCSYDYLASITKYVVRGLERQYSDAMAIEYCRLSRHKENIFVVIIFPSAFGKERQVKEILQNHGNIVYHKPVYLNHVGGINFVRQLYLGESWLGTCANGFSGAKSKATQCYNKDGMTRVYLVESSLESMQAAKKQIRSLFLIGNHSVHINDTWEETYRIANLVFNKNSLHYLNNSSNKWMSYKNFVNYFNEARNLILGNSEQNGICIGGSATLSVYGMRDCHDIDVLHHQNIEHLSSAPNPIVASHNHQIEFYDKTLDDLIYNPRNYFYFDDIKFISLPRLQAMKLNRCEKKDIQDTYLLYDFLFNSPGMQTI